MILQLALALSQSELHGSQGERGRCLHAGSSKNTELLEYQPISNTLLVGNLLPACSNNITAEDQSRESFHHQETILRTVMMVTTGSNEAWDAF